MRRPQLLLLVAGVAILLGTAQAQATTNQFRGVNWADPRDNFQSGVVYVSGLSSSDTYASASATGTSVMTQFVSKLGANAVRMPINEATVSSYWGTYTGAIDAVLAKGTVVLCYWDSAKTNKPPDMTTFWNMWKTVVDKYGGNGGAYFEVFNEPNMYSTTDLVSLYGSWLAQFPTVPRNRVILDGTGDAQNVPNIGSASALDGCLLGVHDYSFFGPDTWTGESQWASQFQGEVGSYADRTICTEWGGPMSPGSKNGVSYGPLDYSQSPTNYFEAYIRGVSGQLRAWNMGSFYWAGLKDGDWYSMTTRSGSGSGIALSVSNQSGLDRLQYAWTSIGGAGGAGGGATGSGGAAGGSAASGGQTGQAGRAGGTGGTGAGGTGGVVIGTGGAGGSAGASSGGHGGSMVTTGGASGGTAGTGGASVGVGGAIASTGGNPGASGGAGGAASGGGGTGQAGSGTGGSSPPADANGDATTGCSCATAEVGGDRSAGLALLLLVALSAAGRRRSGVARGADLTGARPRGRPQGKLSAG
jgi:MYXO-CTERM domain-containing protein